MSSWNIKKLEDIVRLKHGDDIANSLRESLQSFNWKMALFCYHSDESRNTLQNAVENSEISPNIQDCIVAATYLQFLSAANDPKAKPFRIACFCSEAHLIAAAQALHSAADIVGSSIFWSLNLKEINSSLKFEDISLRNVNNFLKNTRDIRYEKITVAIDKLLGSSQFAQLNAYVNTTKHRSLVKTNFSIDFEPDFKYGLKIKAFQYKPKQTFTEVWSEKFLKDGRDIQNKLLIIGNAINDYYS
jgi:hypothetical protein